jgi:hypothetical protein
MSENGVPSTSSTLSPSLEAGHREGGHEAPSASLEHNYGCVGQGILTIRGMVKEGFLSNAERAIERAMARR